jgi:hypothetical protein
MLGQACLSIVANKWVKLEDQNYSAYVARRITEASANTGMIP